MSHGDGKRVRLGGTCEAGVSDRGLVGREAGGRPDRGNLGSHVGADPVTVAANRERLRAAIGASRLVFTRQVHGTAVADVGPDLPGGVSELGLEADALVCARPDVALAVVVADCLPVLLADPQAGVVAAAHAGRPGLAAGILPATLAAMARMGGRADRTAALIGPGVCGRCYEVPAAMRDDVAGRLPAAAATTRRGTPSLDLPAAAERQLRDLGVAVHRDPRCTLETPALFSHRRDGRERPTGRFAGWVVRR